jgi:hypothetical protein
MVFVGTCANLPKSTCSTAPSSTRGQSVTLRIQVALSFSGLCNGIIPLKQVTADWPSRKYLIPGSKYIV